MNELKQIIAIDWKEKWRSSIWHRQFLVNAFLVLTFLYLAGNLLFIGIVLDDIMMKISVEGITYQNYPNAWVLMRLNRYLLYYFFFDFMIRYFMQKLPALAIQPYMHLPIRRSKLVNFMLAKSLGSGFNILHLLLLGPFAIEVFENMPFSEALGWTASLACVILFVHFALIFLKRTSELNSAVFVSMIALVASVVALQWFDVVDFNHISGSLFNIFFKHPIALLLPAAALVLIYWVNFNYLKSNFYMDSLTKSTDHSVSYRGSGVLSRFGMAGRLVELDFKFIWRNKRTKSVLLLTLLFLGYGLLIFPQAELRDNVFMHVIFSLIITGMFILNYGQYLLGWESTQFDHILTRNISFVDYYKSKFLLFFIVSTACFILSIPYVYFGLNILYTLFCLFLFNVGVNSFVVMFFGSLNPKRIDLTKGSMMNWQGVGAAQFLLGIPVMGLPIGIVAIGGIFLTPTQSIGILGALGVVGLAGTQLWLNALSKWLEKRRHEIAADFRTT